MKSLIKLLPLITFLCISFVVTTVYAQEEATDSAETSKDEVRQKLKERLEKTVQGESEEGAETATGKSKWYATFGTINEAALTTLTLETSDKKSVQIQFNEDTELSLYQAGKGTRTIAPEDIETGWFAIAMGTEYASENSLTAKRISFSIPSTIKPPEKKVVVGKISEIDDTTITISNGEKVTASIPKAYDLKVKGIEAAELEDVSINNKVISIIEKVVVVNKKTDEEEITYTVKSLYIVPNVNSPMAADANNLLQATESAESTPSAEDEE